MVVIDLKMDMKDRIYLEYGLCDKIRNDEEDFIKTCDENMRKLLLHGWIVIKHTSSVDFTVSRPWCLAACHGSHKVMEALLDLGVDVLQTDYKDNNILHCLITTAFLNPNSENEVLKTYDFLVINMKHDDLRTLLMHENGDGFQPLELSVHLGAFTFFEKMFETEGLYVTSCENEGMFQVITQDVTLYENPQSPRYARSPIYLLSLLDKNQMKRESTSRIYSSHLIQHWTSLKMKSNLPFLVVWGTFRLIYIVLYSLQNCLFNSGNIQPWQINFKYSTKIVLIVCSLLMILWDICEFAMSKISQSKWKNHWPKGIKSFVRQQSLYRLLQFFLPLFIAYSLILEYLQHVYGYDSVPGYLLPTNPLRFFLFSVMYLSLIYSILYFVQIMPIIGHFVITINRMLSVMGQFLIVFIIFSLIFTQGFYVAINTLPLHVMEKYDTFLESMYALFITMFNMVDFYQFAKYEAGFLILHVFFTLSSSVLLLNFLIAILSNAVAEGSQYEQTIFTVQRLYVLSLMERRVAKIMPRVVWWWKKNCFYCQQENVYIESVVLNCHGKVTVQMAK